jgi:hypothetical protein
VVVDAKRAEVEAEFEPGNPLHPALHDFLGMLEGAIALLAGAHGFKAFLGAELEGSHFSSE